MNPHIEEEKIIDFLGGNLPSPEKTAIESHFAGCCECSASLREAQEGDIFLKSLKINPDPNLENLSSRILETITSNGNINRPVPQLPSNWNWLSDFSLAFVIITGVVFGYMNLIKEPQSLKEKPTVSRGKYQAVSPFTSFSHLTPGTPDKKFSPSKILGNEGSPGSKNLISRFSPQGTSFKIIK